MKGCFDIFNSERRKVVCVNNKEMGMMASSQNHPLLDVGKQYTLVDVEVNSWYTLVSLEEFPDTTFNSLAFSEVA